MGDATGNARAVDTPMPVFRFKSLSQGRNVRGAFSHVEWGGLRRLGTADLISPFRRKSHTKRACLVCVVRIRFYQSYPEYAYIFDVQWRWCGKGILASIYLAAANTRARKHAAVHTRAADTRAISHLGGHRAANEAK